MLYLQAIKSDCISFIYITDIISEEYHNRGMVGKLKNIKYVINLRGPVKYGDIMRDSCLFI